MAGTKGSQRKALLDAGIRAAIFSLSEERNTVLQFFVCFHMHILRRPITVQVPFASPFGKPHTKKRFIHFKILSVHRVKPACIPLAYNVALSQAL